MTGAVVHFPLLQSAWFFLPNWCQALRNGRNNTKAFLFLNGFSFQLFLAPSWEVYLASLSTPYLLKPAAPEKPGTFSDTVAAAAALNNEAVTGERTLMVSLPFLPSLFLFFPLGCAWAPFRVPVNQSLCPHSVVKMRQWRISASLHECLACNSIWQPSTERRD